MGVAGVAWATFICQGISCVLAIVVVFRHLGALQSEKKAVWFSMPVFLQIDPCGSTGRTYGSWHYRTLRKGQGQSDEGAYAEGQRKGRRLPGQQDSR